MQAANNLIKELGRLIGLESLELDASGHCTLAFDDTIVLTFVADGNDGLNAVSYIGDLPDNDSQAVRALLAHNFVPGGLGGGRVALEPDSTRAVLVSRWDGVRTDFGMFQQQLEAFVNAVETIRGELASGGAGPGASTPAQAPAGLPPGLSV